MFKLDSSSETQSKPLVVNRTEAHEEDKCLTINSFHVSLSLQDIAYKLDKVLMSWIVLALRRRPPSGSQTANDYSIDINWDSSSLRLSRLDVKFILMRSKSGIHNKRKTITENRETNTQRWHSQHRWNAYWLACCLSWHCAWWFCIWTRVRASWSRRHHFSSAITSQSTTKSS